MSPQASGPSINRYEILENLRKSVECFQDALNLVEQDPQLSADIPVLQEAIVKANEVYSSVWRTVQASEAFGISRPIKVLQPLRFRKSGQT